MNMKLAGLFGGLMALIALEACVVVTNVDCTKDPTDPSCAGNGGGGNGTGGDTTSSSSSSSSGKGGGGGGTAGGGGTGMCVGCGTFASDPMAGTLCEASKAIYDEARACTCDRAAADAMPGCKDVCGDNRCMGMTSSADCDKCLLQGACATATAACANDG